MKSTQNCSGTFFRQNIFEVYNRKSGKGCGMSIAACDTFSNGMSRKMTVQQMEKEKSSISTDSTSSGAAIAANSSGSTTSSKLYKFGRRLRESCRQLKGKSGFSSSSGQQRNNPEDYCAIQAPGVIN